VNEVLEYKQGVAKGTVMSDMDCLRFYNGMIAVLTDQNGLYRLSIDPQAARKGIPGVMDRLFEAGYVATVGYAGTPVISARR
jgi:hypothetical protein